MKYGKRLCLQLESENSSSRGSTSPAAKAVFEKQESSEAQVAKFLWAGLPPNAVDYDEPTGADDDILSTAVDWFEESSDSPTRHEEIYKSRLERCRRYCAAPVTNRDTMRY